VSEDSSLSLGVAVALRLPLSKTPSSNESRACVRSSSDEGSDSNGRWPVESTAADVADAIFTAAAYNERAVRQREWWQ
jgi:hypothetical protein